MTIEELVQEERERFDSFVKSATACPAFSGQREYYVGLATECEYVIRRLASSEGMGSFAPFTNEYDNAFSVFFDANRERRDAGADVYFAEHDSKEKT